MLRCPTRQRKVKAANSRPLSQDSTDTRTASYSKDHYRLMNSDDSDASNHEAVRELVVKEAWTQSSAFSPTWPLSTRP